MKEPRAQQVAGQTCTISGARQPSTLCGAGMSIESGSICLSKRTEQLTEWKFSASTVVAAMLTNLKIIAFCLSLGLEEQHSEPSEGEESTNLAKL